MNLVNEKARAGGRGKSKSTGAVYVASSANATDIARVDVEDIAHALRLILLPGQVTELRALDVVTSVYRRPHVVSGYFDDVDKLAQAAASIEGAKGVYIVLNPINPALLARASNRVRPIDREPLTSDADITRRLWLPIDLDADRPAGISSTDAEHAAAIDRAHTIRDALSGEGWTPPIMADSGNGAHLLYSIDLPVDDGGLVKRCLQALDLRFGDDAVSVDLGVFNPARIWKLYGTVARKGDSTPDRPHRLSRILEAPGELEPVPVERLDALAATLPKEDIKPTGKSRPFGYNGQRFDLEQWMRERCPDAIGPTPYQGGSKWVFPVCPWNPDHTNRSAFVRQDAGGMIGAGCHHNGCTGKGWRELRELKEPGAYRERGTAQPRSNAETTADTAAPCEPSDVDWTAFNDAPDPEPVTPKPTFKNARILMQNHTALRPPVIHGLLREGEIMNIIAPPKTGKSWLVTQMAISQVTGRMWLGKFQVERGNVLILDNELHGETIANRLPRVAAAMGAMTDEYADGLYVDCLRGRLLDIFAMGAYFNAIEPGRFGTIVIDAFYRAMPAGHDENDNGGMANIYNHLDRYAERLRCAFVLIHHASKGNQSEKAVTDVGAGAGSMARATDTHLILRPHAEEGVVVLDAAVRSWPPIAPFCLRWEFPIWTPADDLDPNDLRKAGRPRKRDEVAAPEPVKWTPELFAARFVTQAPTARQLILAKAAIAGITDRQGASLLALAVDARLVYPWAHKGNAPQTFATLPQPETKDT